MERLALHCAHMSKWAYCSDADLAREHIDELGGSIKDVVLIVRKNAAVLMAIVNNLIFCAWRGTEPANTADWLTNANVAKVSAPEMGGKVHRGFYQYYAQALPFVLEQLEQWRNAFGPLPIVITGHSLGGAAATLMHRAWQGDSLCYVYGSPRVGNGAFARNYDKRIERFSMYGDPVTRLPTVLRWRHVSTVHLVTQYGTLWNLPRKVRAWVAVQNFFHIFFTGRFIDEIRKGARNHSIDLYIRRLYDIQPGHRRVSQRYG